MNWVLNRFSLKTHNSKIYLFRSCPSHSLHCVKKIIELDCPRNYINQSEFSNTILWSMNLNKPTNRTTKIINFEHLLSNCMSSMCLAIPQRIPGICHNANNLANTSTRVCFLYKFCTYLQFMPSDNDDKQRPAYQSYWLNKHIFISFVLC